MAYFKGLDSKYLISAPAPLGRILNYVTKIRTGAYTGSRRGVREATNLDNWTVNFMVGLGLVEIPAGAVYVLTPIGEQVYDLIQGRTFEDEEGAGKHGMRRIKDQLKTEAPAVYDGLKAIFLETYPLQNISEFFRQNDLASIDKATFYQRYGAEFGIQAAGFNRITSAVQLAEFCDVLIEDGEIRVYDEYYVREHKKYTDKQYIRRKTAEEATAPIDDDLFKNISPKLDPERRTRVVESILRDAKLAGRLKRAYDGKCQLCGFTFKKRNGDNYSEVHHVIALGERGSDSITNMIVVCSRCHSELTYATVELGEFKPYTRTLKINGETRTIKYLPEHYDATIN